MMARMDDQGRPVVWAVVTGAPPARDVDKLVDLAQADGWQVCVFASPAGRHFIDGEALAAKTGYAVRWEYREPGTVSSSPAPDVIIAAPITCNSLAKWATGISDTLPLGILVSAVAWGTPTVAMPFSNRIQLSHPGVQEAIRKLSDWGIIMLASREIYEPHEPGTGSKVAHLFPWHVAWEAALHAHAARTAGHETSLTGTDVTPA